MAARTPCSTTRGRDSYERRRPDETRLYQLIEEHWPTFLERAEQSGGLPSCTGRRMAMLPDGYVLTFRSEDGTVHWVNARREIDGAAYWSTRTVSSGEQRDNAVAFCKSLRK